MADELATIAAFEGALKEDYLDVINEQLNYEAVLESQLENNSEDVEGLEAVMSLEMSPNVSFGYASDGTSLPDASYPIFKKARLQLKQVYASFIVSGPLLRASASKVGAWTPALQALMENLVKSMKKARNHFNYGDGSGALAKVVTAPDANTITIDRWCSLFEDARYLDSWTLKTGGSQNMTAKKIASSDRATKTLTITGHGASVGDFIYLKSSRNIAQMGLTGIIDDGTYLSTHQGLSRTTYPRWKANVLHNNGTGRNLSEELLQAAMAVLRMVGAAVDMWTVTPFALNDLIFGMQLQRQFVNPTQKFVGGIRAVDIGNAKVVEDPDMLAGHCFGITKKDLVFYTAGGKANWLKEPGAGNILRMVVDSNGRKDAFEGTLALYRELGSRRNNSHVVLRDIAENTPTGY